MDGHGWNAPLDCQSPEAANKLDAEPMFVGEIFEDDSDEWASPELRTF